MLVEFLLNIIYRLLFLFVKKPKETGDKKYYFSICGIFKNEAPYLKEWIDYYSILGVGHIYLYNNNSTDGFRAVLQPYIEEGFVTLIDWERNYAQMEAYEDCFFRFRRETQWLAFFDIDEFLCPLKEYKINDFLQKYEGYPGIMIYWKMFGTNGQLEPREGKLVTEQYTSSWKELDGTGKVIISTNTEYSPTRFYHHSMVFRRKVFGFLSIKIPVITEHRFFKFFPQIYLPPRKNNTIQLNHYFSKSYNEFMAKKLKGDAVSKANEVIRKTMDFFLLHEKHNTGVDKSIYRYLILLKRKYYSCKE